MPKSLSRFSPGSVEIGTTGRITKPSGTPKQNERIAYAWEISKDKHFIYKLESENNQWDELKQSDVLLRWGELEGEDPERVYTCNTPGDTLTDSCEREQSFGFCQIHEPSHPGLVNTPRFFTDWKWQMRKCLYLYKNGTPMYGEIEEVVSRFQFITN